MKKFYLAVIFCCLYVTGFATTWYSQNAGDASVLTNWNDAMDGSGTAPVTFDSSGDTWIMSNDMNCSVFSLFIAGSLIIDSAYFTGPDTLLAIGGNLSLVGNAVLDAQYLDGGVPYSGPTILTIGGNLSVTETAYITNSPSYTTIVFNNASSTFASPQTITWTSTAIGSYAQMNINAGCIVQLLSNVTLPVGQDAADSVYGTLICASYVLSCNSNPFGFQLTDGATLSTANAGGIDSSVTNPGRRLTFSAAANYVFNGAAGQFTGLLMPSMFMAGGSVTSNNAAGLTLSQSTGFGSGSTLSLSGGNLILGASNLNLDVSASLTGPFSSAGMIVTNGGGQLQQQFSTDGSFLYPVGDTAGNYSPITLNVTARAYAIGAAYAGVTVTNSKEPHNANANNYLNRYWSIALSGITSPSYTIAGATYIAPGDVVGSDANISAGLYAGALPWIKFGPANTVTQTLSSTAITNTTGNFTGISTAGPSISGAPDIALCFGQSALLSVTAEGDTPLSYSWVPATGLSDTVGTSVTAMPDTTTTYTITVTDANGFTATASSTVTVNPLPSVHTVTGGGSYCAGAGGVHVGLDGSDPGISYQLLLNDTLAIGAPMPGTGASLDFGLDTAAGAYSVVAADTTTLCTSNMVDSAVIVINPLPSIHAVTGGGGYCAGTGGVHVGLDGSDPGISYQLWLNDTLAIGSSMAGSGASLDFGLDTAAGVYSIVATDTTTLCTANMADSAVIAINPLPSIHTVTGGGGYCAGTGGVHVGLDGSNPGINYQLLLNDTLAIGAPMAGTGASLDFGLDTVGAYSIVATDTTTLCTANMVDSAVITVNPLPSIHTVTGGGSYCAGTGGVHVGLNGSDFGISYQLLLNDTLAIGSPMAGTGASLDFGLDTAAGTYSIIATDTTTLCTANMSGNVAVTINPLPAFHTLIGGGGYCAGAAGVHVRLDGSDTGVRYQLYFETTLTGSSVAGTGSPLDFGLETVAGAYTVVATDTTTGCFRNMVDSAVVVINPLPATHTVTGGGSYCAGTGGVHIGLSGSDTGVHYQLYYSGTTAVGGYFAGTGSLFTFGLDTAAGSYTVIATNASTGCASNMVGSAVVIITPVVIPSVSISSSIADTICAGETITFTASPMHGGGEPGYQWMVNGTAEGAHSTTYSYIPVNGDLVSVKLTSDTTCAIPDTATDTMTVVVHPRELPTVTLTIAPGDTICEGTSVVITATPGYGGDAPAYTWIKNMVVVSTDSTYSYTPVNGDNVYCTMQSDYFCRSATTAYSNVIDMTVETPVVPSVYITVDPGTYVAKSDSFTAIVTNGGDDPSYQWYVNDTPYAGAVSPGFKLPALRNKDSISCIVTRNDVCHLSTFTSVIVRVGDLGVQQAASVGYNITLTPNPNNGAFTVAGSLGSSQVAGEDVDIEITDMLGQVVYRNKVTSLDGGINTEVKANILADGVYILTLHSESGNSAIRFVVQR